ncbi:MAG: GDSL family lipase [Clostridia bacterium]|nr:GDSL family lipase [Clostridia bacterium]
MKIIEKIKAKQKDLSNNSAITIAFIGDSVTQGCFECYTTSDTAIDTVFDYKSAFSTRVKEILNILYPNVQFNIINAGVSGDRAASGYKRLERDVIAFNPDVCVVSYGLNDSCCSVSVDEYAKSLENIFLSLKNKDIETVFLTQNCMNTKTSCHLTDELLKKMADKFSIIQNDGTFKKYMEAAKRVSKNYGVKICDLYSIWERLISLDVDVTELLANKLNHPIREFHYYIAIKLVETILYDNDLY